MKRKASTIFERCYEPPRFAPTAALSVRGLVILLCAVSGACSFDTMSSEPTSSRASSVGCAPSGSCSGLAVASPSLPPLFIAALGAGNPCNDDWFADAGKTRCWEPEQAGWSFFRAMDGRVPELARACEYVWSRSSPAPEEGPLPGLRQEPTRVGCVEGLGVFPKVMILKPACSGSSCLGLSEEVSITGMAAFAGSGSGLVPPPSVSEDGGRPIYYDPVVRRLWTLAALERIRLNATQYEIPGTGLYEFASSPSNVSIVQYTIDGDAWTTLWHE